MPSDPSFELLFLCRGAIEMMWQMIAEMLQNVRVQAGLQRLSEADPH